MYKERVETALRNLSEIKRELEAEDPDAKTLQVTSGNNFAGVPLKEIFIQAFQRHVRDLRVNERRDVEDVFIDKITVEENYVLSSDGKLQRSNEMFILFDTPRSAANALRLGIISMYFGNIILSSPKQPAVMRSTYREIGALVTRIQEIEKELKSIGALREYGRPVLPTTWVDRSWFEEKIPQWKRARAEGKFLDHHAYTPLKAYRMVDRNALQSRIDALYNEECDIHIRLHEFQLAGVKFEYKG